MRAEPGAAGSAGRAEPGQPKRSASEQVAEEIRLYVRDAALAPGDRLGREEDLARRFGVSRPTLREALRLLSSSHLIRASKGPGGGIFVEAMPEEGIGRVVSEAVASMLEAQSIGIDELLETRILLEVPLVGLAAQRASEADIDELRALLAEEGGDDPQEELIASVDARLHRRIAGIAGNRLAAAFTEWVDEVLQPLLRELIAPAVVDSFIVEQHRDIVRAIERGDPGAAERAMREHLVYLLDLVSAVTGDRG